MKLLQAILIVIGVYLAVRLIVRMYGKSILKWAGAKAMQRVQRQFEKRQAQQSRGENKSSTSFKNSSQTQAQQKKKPKKTVGEYVDFEEID